MKTNPLNSDNNEITRAEIEAIEYLKAFKTVDETIITLK
jgi:hypothetical protein